VLPRVVGLLLVLCCVVSAQLAPALAAAPAQRVVSLVPSLTEDLFAIGAGPHVVAVSDYTDYPAEAKRLPVVGSAISVATERIVALHPDLVIGIPSQAQLVADLRRAGVRVVLVADDSFDDIFLDLRVLGDLTGRRAAADALAVRLRRRTAALQQSAVRRGVAPSVFVVLGDAPIYTVGRGSYIARLIELAGGRNAANDLHQPYGIYSAEALVAKQPQVLIAGGEVRLAASLGRSPWNALRAVASHRLYSVPDRIALYRPGPRYTDGLAWLIATLDRAVRH
jgi:iron complex transport system substrate-binding protein